MKGLALRLACGALAAALATGSALAARPSASRSGLHGIVYRGPTSPVCRNEIPCVAPAPGVVLFFSHPGWRKRSVKTAADGSYRILVPAAIYTVTTDQEEPGKRPAPRRVRVRVGHVDRLDFQIDTGIR